LPRETHRPRGQRRLCGDQVVHERVVGGTAPGAPARTAWRSTRSSSVPPSRHS